MAFGVPATPIIKGWNAFWNGGFNAENEWVSGMKVGNMADDTSPMNDASSYAYSQPNAIIPNDTSSVASASYPPLEYPYVPSDDGPFDYTGVPLNPNNQFFGDEDADFDANTVYDMGEMDDGQFIYDRRGLDDSDNLLPGWEYGLDDVPYNTALFALNDAAIAAAGGGGGGGGYGSGGGGSSAPAASLFQDLSQRTPSGTQYAPDLSAYNDSSLFNYTGPGGLSEYTYGQGLPTQGAGYDIWGTPTDMVNPYYTGQFAPESTGVADGAISLPPVDMPAGVAPTNNNPNVGTSNTNINTGGGTGPGGKDLTYQETIDYFGLTPQSTTFPGPNDKLIEEQILNENAIREGLAPPRIIDQGGVHDTGPLPPTAEQMRALSDINYGKTPYASPGNPHGIEPLRTIDRQRLTYGEPMEWFEDTNNPKLPLEYTPDIYDEFAGGEWEARKNFLRPPADEDTLKRIRTYKDVPDGYSLFDNEYDLGRPGDPSYEEFVPNPSLFTDYPGLDAIMEGQKIDHSEMLNAMADKTMANITKEELRDGLFLEPTFHKSTGKMTLGIPDVFTQDKSPIEPRSTLFDDPFGEFDPDNRYAEPDLGDAFLWQDKEGEYHQPWDDMGLETYIPGSFDEDFMSGKTMTEAQSLFDNAQAVENAKAAEATRLRDIESSKAQAEYTRQAMAEVERTQALAREQAQALAQAQAMAAKQAQAQAAAQAQAQAAAQAQAEAAAQARAQVAAQVEERTQVREQARRPVYTAPPAYTPPASTGSSWSPSYGTGGIWRL